MSTTLKVTAKGQVTLRKDVLKHLGVRPGDRLAVDKLPDGKVEIQASPAGDLARFRGSLKSRTGKKLTIEEINKIIERGWAGEL